MISVKKDYDHPPEKLTSKHCQNIIAKALTEKRYQDASENYYKDPEVKKALARIYHGKCGYCEIKSGIEAYTTIDHYRPKKQIADYCSGKYISEGYYWMACEWSNLIPACAKCNTAKSSFFPLENEKDRLNSSQWAQHEFRSDSDAFMAENPLLINPEIDEPEKHFIFLTNGKVRGRTERGRITIEILDLNRESLSLARKKKVDAFLKAMKEIICICVQSKNYVSLKPALKLLFTKLWAMQSPEKKFSRLGWFMFEDFELFFIAQLSGEKQQKMVKKVFALFCDKKL